MNYKISFLYGHSFKRKWKKLNLTENDRKKLNKEILSYLINAPTNYGKRFPGNIIEGTGGAIKYRFAPSTSNAGKSGSYRIIYFVFDTHLQNVFFLDIYAKNERASLSKSEKNNIKTFIRSLKTETNQGEKNE